MPDDLIQKNLIPEVRSYWLTKVTSNKNMKRISRIFALISCFSKSRVSETEGNDTSNNYHVKCSSILIDHHALLS